MQVERNYSRLRTIQIAQLHVEGDPRIASCEIRDFCPSGLFLRIAEEEKASIGNPGQKTPVTLEFDCESQGGTRTYIAAGTIVHVGNEGLGVYAPMMGGDVFQALLDFRATLYRGAGEESRADLDAVDIETIRTHCESLFRPFVKHLYADFIERLRVRNRQIESESAFLADRRRDDVLGIGKVLAAADRIGEAFIADAMLRTKMLIAPRTRQRISQQASPNILSLVQEEEFEDWLHIETAVTQAEQAMEQSLGFFERLYSQVVLRLEFWRERFAATEPEYSPFSPRSLFEALQEGLRVIALRNQERASLYEDFATVLVREGRSVYEQLARVIAVAERRQSRSGRSTARSAREDLGQRDDDAREFGGQGYAADYEALAGRRAEGSQTRGYGFERTLSGLKRPAHPGMPGGSAFELGRGGGRFLDATAMLRQVAAGLGDIGSVVDLPFVLPRSGEDMALPVAGVDDLLRAIEDAIGKRPRRKRRAGDASFTERIAPVIERMVGRSMRIDPVQAELLDALGSLFDNLLDDYPPHSEVAELMRGFEVPFFKLALSDPEFLHDEEHPLRKLMNLVDEFAIAADDSGKFFDSKVFVALKAILEPVWASCADEATSAQQALQTLEKMLRPLQRVRRQRVLRHQESSESRLRLSKARERVAGEIERRVGCERIPRIVLKLLLDAGWRQYFCLLDLREGAQSETWHGAMNELDGLCSLLRGEVAGDGTDEPFASLPDSLKRRLDSVSIEPERIEQMIEELRTRLSQPACSVKDGLEFVDLQRGWLQRDQEEEQQRVAAAESRLTGRLQLGSWWTIRAENGVDADMQLVWSSDPPGRHVFVNRSATRKTEMDVQAIVRAEKDGGFASAPDRKLGVFERTENSMVDALYEELVRLTTRDPVTGLLNRKALLRSLQQIPLSATGCDEHSLAMLRFEQLRAVLLKYGVEARDDLLRELAAMVGKLIRPQDVLADIGEGEFAVHFVAVDARTAREHCLRMIMKLHEYRFARDGQRLGISTAIGISSFVPGDSDPGTLLLQADAACAQAERSAPNTIEVYDARDASNPAREMAERMDELLRSDNLYLRCQQVAPVDAEAGMPAYYEILLGVRDDKGVEIGPQSFIEAVERSNRAHDVDIWVFGTTLRWIRENRRVFDAIGGFSLNLSAQSMRREEVRKFLRYELARGDLPLEKISFEITETGTIGSYIVAQEFIREIRGYGCGFCIDDFGSGYASYAYLRNLRTDTLKIDGIFVREILQNPSDFAMVRSMCEIGHSLGMKVVAEFVASAEILEAVREIGVDFAQGYAIHKPMPLAELASVVEIACDEADATAQVERARQAVQPEHAAHGKTQSNAVAARGDTGAEHEREATPAEPRKPGGKRLRKDGSAAPRKGGRKPRPAKPKAQTEKSP